MAGFLLRNNRQRVFYFPTGFQIQAGRPVKIFTGSGINTDTELYWGLARGVWDDMGDCAHLVHPIGIDYYRLRSGPDLQL